MVLGGGIGANAQLLDDVRPLLAQWLPYPPRVEISSLGRVPGRAEVTVDFAAAAAGLLLVAGVLGALWAPRIP